MGKIYYYSSWEAYEKDPCPVGIDPYYWATRTGIVLKPGEQKGRVAKKPLVVDAGANRQHHLKPRNKEVES